MLTSLSQDLTKKITPHEEEMATRLMAAGLTNNKEEVERLLCVRAQSGDGYRSTRVAFMMLLTVVALIAFAVGFAFALFGQRLLLALHFRRGSPI